MARYTLQKDGDYWEKKWWPYLKDRFPNYEKFWQAFIAEPLTNRSQDIRIRKGIHEVLEALAMAHYSVFHHLGNTHWLVELNQNIQKTNSETNRQPTLHSECFFHLSSATEMLERLIFEIWRAAIEVDLLPRLDPISEDSITEQLQETVDGNGYAKRFEKYLITGQSVNHTFHSIRDAQESLSKLVQDPEEWEKSWKQFIKITDGRIRAYRNVLAHNPILGSKESEGMKRTPKPDKLSKYRLWSSVFYNLNEEDFLAIDEFMEEQLNMLESALNEIWGYLISIMEKVGNTKGYSVLLGDRKVLARGKVEDGILAVSSSEAEISSSVNQPIKPSGTDIDPSQ